MAGSRRCPRARPGNRRSRTGWSSGSWTRRCRSSSRRSSRARSALLLPPGAGRPPQAGPLDHPRGHLDDLPRRSAAVAHGHFNAVYGPGFLAFPGILAVFAPLGALTNAFHTTAIQVTRNGFSTPGVHYLVLPGTPYFLTDFARSGGKFYDIHRGVSVVLLPLMLLLSCVALFALDALAERLGVTRERRAVLCVVQAVLLWSVTVFAGHPEDAVALALAVYALIFAFDRRFTGAGWLFGAAVAVQPLVIVLFPLLLALGGRSCVLGLVVKGALPAVVFTIPPLAAGTRTTPCTRARRPADLSQRG